MEDTYYDDDGYATAGTQDEYDDYRGGEDDYHGGYTDRDYEGEQVGNGNDYDGHDDQDPNQVEQEEFRYEADPRYLDDHYDDGGSSYQGAESERSDSGNGHHQHGDDIQDQEERYDERFGYVHDQGLDDYDRYPQGDDEEAEQYRSSIDSGNGGGHQDDGSQGRLYEEEYQRGGDEQEVDDQGRGYQEFEAYNTNGVYRDFLESYRYTPSEFQQDENEQDRRYEFLRQWNVHHGLTYDERDRWWPTAGELETHDGTGYRRGFSRESELQRANTCGYKLDDDRLDVIQWLKEAEDLDSCIRAKQD